MIILGIECSAIAASCALMKDGVIIAKAFTNVKLTHSETLLPMVVNMLNSAKTDIDSVDCFAISNGPGSFTGIRIGISAIKGLAAAGNKPCVGVSTLESMAYMHTDFNGIICSLMDARCNQFYNGLFSVKNGVVTRLCEDRAMLFDEIIKDLADNFSEQNILLVGDGASLFYEKLKHIEHNLNVAKCSETNILQQADGVLMLAQKHIEKNDTISAEELLPFYLRLPQAERELKKRKEEEK